MEDSNYHREGSRNTNKTEHSKITKDNSPEKLVVRTQNKAKLHAKETQSNIFILILKIISIHDRLTLQRSE